MAFRRLRVAAVPAVLAVSLLGVGCAGSGSHTDAERAPAPVVLGAVESRPGTPDASPADPGAGAPSTTAAAEVEAPGEAGTLADASADAAPDGGDHAAHDEEPAAVPEPAAAAPAARPPDAEALTAATLARIAYPWQDVLTGWHVQFLGPRSGLRGLTYPAERRIEIYVRGGDTPATLARVLAHELGHALDVQRNDARDRARWREVRGAGPTVPWWPDDSVSDFATLAGDFAEAFAVWQTGAVSQSTVAGQPTAEQLEVLAALVS